jgi:hypothetical protein
VDRVGKINHWEPFSGGHSSSPVNLQWKRFRNPRIRLDRDVSIDCVVFGYRWGEAVFNIGSNLGVAKVRGFVCPVTVKSLACENSRQGQGRYLTDYGVSCKPRKAPMCSGVSSCHVTSSSCLALRKARAYFYQIVSCTDDCNHCHRKWKLA